MMRRSLYVRAVLHRSIPIVLGALGAACGADGADGQQLPEFVGPGTPSMEMPLPATMPAADTPAASPGAPATDAAGGASEALPMPTLTPGGSAPNGSAPSGSAPSAPSGGGAPEEPAAPAPGQPEPMPDGAARTDVDADVG